MLNQKYNNQVVNFNLLTILLLLYKH